MKDDLLRELEKRYMLKTTEDLVRAITIEQNDYEPDVIKVILKELEKRNITKEEINSIRADIERKRQTKAKSIMGISGFLFLFLIMLGLYSLVTTSIGVLILIAHRETLSYLVSIPNLVVGIYGFLVLSLLVRKKRTAPINAMLWIILSFFVTLMYSFIAAAIFSVVWLLYFLHSKRVALNYMPEYKTTYDYVKWKFRACFGSVLRWLNQPALYRKLQAEEQMSANRSNIFKNAPMNIKIVTGYNVFSVLCCLYFFIKWNTMFSLLYLTVLVGFPLLITNYFLLKRSKVAFCLMLVWFAIQCVEFRFPNFSLQINYGMVVYLSIKSKYIWFNPIAIIMFFILLSARKDILSQKKVMLDVCGK